MTTNEIAKEQKCIVMRNGIEIWTDADKASRFQKDWESNAVRGAVGFEGRSLNTADLLGVFFPCDMEDLRRRKNFQWKCQHGTWHDRQEKCECVSSEQKELNDLLSRAIKECGKCNNGWITGERGVRRCDCVVAVYKRKGDVV